ncbi:MAG: LPXTG cell wall anchor domain-containing protein [Oscillospiraceae bacterium]|nr:LPXTG cell wall anchor domain-containing protein [Oscillospiraceae bacterium]
MKKAIKKPLSIVLVIIALVCLATQVFNALALDDFEHGDQRMTVILEDDTTPIRGMQIGVCRVATIYVQSGGRLRFDLISPEFDDFPYNWPQYMDIYDGELRELARALSDYVTNRGIRRIYGTSDDNGRTIFDNLEHGYYLVMQMNPSSGAGSYYTFLPSLVAIGREGVETTEVLPKVEHHTIQQRPTPTPTPLPSLTPTPSGPPASPTPGANVSPTPTPSGPPTSPTPGADVTPTPSLGAYQPTLTPGAGGTPTPSGDTDIDNPDVPTTDFPPDGDKPGRLPQTGVIDWNLIIILLTSFGVLLLLIGIILQKRRDQRS